MKSWLMLIALALLPALQGCVAMKSVNAADEFEMIYFAQGDDEGKLLYQFSEIGKDVLPNRMLVDAQGRFYFLERSLNRIQCFSPEGDFSFAVNITAEMLDLKGDDTGSAELNYLDMFWFADSTLGVLISLGDSPEGPANLVIAKCDADGIILSHVVLQSVPETLISVEYAYLDEMGFLWIFQDAWFVFDQLGNYDSTVEDYGHFVDSKGFCYSDVKPVQVHDRNGKLMAALKAGEEPTPDQVAFVSDKGMLVSWTRGLPETKTPTTLAYQNQIILFKLDRSDWHFDPAATIDVPPTEYKYPNDQSDQAIPVQVYLPKTSVIRADVLYILAYSDETFWISKLDIAKLAK